MKPFFSFVFASVLTLFSSVLLAADDFISLNYDDVSVVSLLQSTYRDILSIPYALDGSVASNKSRVTVQIPDLPYSELQSTVDAFLASAGVYKSYLPSGHVVFSSKRLNSAFSGELLDDSGEPLDADGYIDYGSIPSVPSSVLDLAHFPDAVVLGQNYENLEFYPPRHRPALELQALANALLGASYSPYSDMVVIAGSDFERIEQVKYAIEQIDIPPSQAFVRALVVEYSDTSNQASTFDAAISALSGNFGLTIGSALNSSESFIRFSSGDFTALLSAVSGDSRFSVVSSPFLRVLSGRTGRVSVGEEVPTLGSTHLDNQGNSNQSVKYMSSGVILDITPKIFRDRMELDITQQISSFMENRTSGIDSPVLQRRDIRTNLTVHDSELVVLGGMTSERYGESSRGFSFLPRFFRSKSSDSTVSQVLVFLYIERT